MSVTINGGAGGGGSAPTLTSHTADGDTLSHWTFATDLTALRAETGL